MATKTGVAQWNTLMTLLRNMVTRFSVRAMKMYSGVEP